jgi:hypothetical protein
MKLNQPLTVYSYSHPAATLLRQHFHNLEPPPGSYSNDTQCWKGEQRTGTLRFAVRRYADFGSYDLGRRRSASARLLLFDHGLARAAATAAGR